MFTTDCNACLKNTQGSEARELQPLDLNVTKMSGVVPSTLISTCFQAVQRGVDSQALLLKLGDSFQEIS